MPVQMVEHLLQTFLVAGPIADGDLTGRERSAVGSARELIRIDCSAMTCARSSIRNSCKIMSRSKPVVAGPNRMPRLESMRQVWGDLDKIAVFILPDMISDKTHPATVDSQAQLEPRVLVTVEPKLRQVAVKNQQGPVGRDRHSLEIRLGYGNCVSFLVHNAVIIQKLAVMGNGAMSCSLAWK